MTAVYLSLKQVGERLGVKNAAAYRLPEPDAMIGTTRGWLPETIDRWNAARPGRGVGGGRPRKEERKKPLQNEKAAPPPAMPGEGRNSFIFLTCERIGVRINPFTC